MNPTLEAGLRDPLIELKTVLVSMHVIAVYLCPCRAFLTACRAAGCLVSEKENLEMLSGHVVYIFL